MLTKFNMIISVR